MYFQLGLLNFEKNLDQKLTPMKLIFILFLLPFSLFSQGTYEKLEHVLDSLHQQGFNGNVLFSRNDSILFKRSYGYAHFETKQPLTDSSLFDLASISKQFTAVALLQQVERGKITFDTKVNEVLPQFPYDNITVEHLLRHQSGLADYMQLFNRKWDKSKIATNDDILAAFAKYRPKLKFTPGSQYVYSNSGYVILASIVEQLTQEKFNDYVKKNILEPSGMHQSKIIRIAYEPEIVAHITSSYSYSKKKKIYQNVYANPKSDEIWLNGIVGDGMIYSTILDMEKWKLALRNNLVLREESRIKMFTPDEVSTKYGYGIGVSQNKVRGDMLFHTGSWAGYLNIMVYFPNSNEFYTVLTNNSTQHLEKVINTLLERTH